MTRMYLSTTATYFAKIGLLLVQLMIGLFNVITLPIRAISLKAYIVLLLATGAGYPVFFTVDPRAYAFAFIICAAVSAITLIVIRIVHKILNKKVSPKVAFMFNSPLGIQLNRFYC